MNSLKVEMNNIGSTEKEFPEDFFTNDINYENHTNKTSICTDTKPVKGDGAATKIKLEININ
jgi:hypothetical protein